MGRTDIRSLLTVELWAAFEAADVAEQTALFRRAIADGLLDDEYAYEMLAHLRDEGDFALWGVLVEELKAARPELYAHSASYYLEWQIADALAAGQLDRLPALAAALAETAGDDLDQFYYSRDRLAYLERTATPRADDPALLAAVEQFGPVDFPEALADQIALIIGGADRPWDRADDPEDTRIDRLGFRFQGELARRWGMPLGRAELARVALLTYIAERRDPDSSIAQTARRPKGKQKLPPPTAADLLCPDRESLDRYLAQKLNFISFQLIDAAVTLEAVPAWLHFLHDQGIISTERRTEALRDLGKLVAHAEPIWAQGPSDPALGPNIRAAWERAAEA